MRTKLNLKFIFFLLFFTLIFNTHLICEDKSENNTITKKYTLKNIGVKTFLEVLPDEFRRLKPKIIQETNSIFVRCTKIEAKLLSEYIRLVDVKRQTSSIHLKYITADELLKHLPPSINHEDISLTSNPNIIFFKGSELKKKQLLKDLKIIDKPKAQIKYQLLIVQYEKSDSFTWAKELQMKKNDSPQMQEFSGTMTNIFDINFNIISKFGYQFIAKLNFSLAENKARVLADTTLNGLTGEEVSFQNTNTFRYVDKTLDSSGKPLYGTLRAITSGLLLNIKGNVSGNEMITMDVKAQISKQGSGGSSSGILPPTSEKIVKTKIRTSSGTPIIIGGLLQLEKNISQDKVPGLGDIPVLGFAFKNERTSETITEMVIYIIPYLEKEDYVPPTQDKRLKSMFFKYVN